MSRRPEWWLHVLARIWPITWKSAMATQWPVIGGLIAKIALPLMSERNFNVTHIPINAEISGVDSSYLPTLVLEELIHRSAHRVIIKRCTCRDERQCNNHSIEAGCIQLGAGTEEIDPRIATHASKEEAIAHMRTCVADGLVPMIGRVKVDNLIWGVRDRGRLLAVCFCCRCCCTVLNSGRYLPDDVAGRIVRLKGLEIHTDHQKCTLCETCVDTCFMGALTLEKGRIVRDNILCKGCGLCVSGCPEKAIFPLIVDVDEAIAELQDRIRNRINFEYPFNTVEH
ncbi:MAG: 4Fe-4S binding protein [bacterium]